MCAAGHAPAEHTTVPGRAGEQRPPWTFLLLSRRRDLPGNGKDDAHLRQLDHQRRTPVTEKRQGDAGGRDQVGDHGDVQEHLYCGQGGDTHHQKGAEAVSGVDGNPVAPHDQQGKENEDDSGPDQAQLLAHDGEDAEILLLLHGYNPNGVEIPGIFGSGLLTAVKTFQKAQGLTVSGTCDRNIAGKSRCS